MSTIPAPVVSVLQPIQHALAAMIEARLLEPCAPLSSVLVCALEDTTRRTLGIARDLIAHADALLLPVVNFMHDVHARPAATNRPVLGGGANGLAWQLAALHLAPPAGLWATLLNAVRAAEREMSLIWTHMYVVAVAPELATRANEVWLFVVYQHNGFPIRTAFEREVPAFALVFSCVAEGVVVPRQCVQRESAERVGDGQPRWPGEFAAAALQFVGACFLDHTAYKNAVPTSTYRDPLAVFKSDADGDDDDEGGVDYY